MERKFKKLKALLFELDIHQTDLCKELGKSQTYMTDRMMGRQPFDIETIYFLCDKLNIPYSEIPVYFPPKGISSGLQAC